MASCKTEGSADAGIVFHNYKDDYGWFSISLSSINPFMPSIRCPWWPCSGEDHGFTEVVLH